MTQPTEHITFEINVLKDAITLAQDFLAKQEIPQTRRKQIIAKYQTRIRQLSASITHQQQLQKLRELETQRQKLMQMYQTQLTEIKQQIHNLTTPTILTDTTQSTQEMPASPASKLETQQTKEKVQAPKKSLFRRLFK
jgi:dTDP-4-amino-4,6-dideoxygalactose transaminase